MSSDSDSKLKTQNSKLDDWTIGRLLDWTVGFLKQKGSESPRLDAEVLLAHALGCRRIDLYTRYDEAAADDARQRFRDLVRQRVEGCPVAYLVGRKEFFSLEFEVGRDVLIPRPDTECVVNECLRLARALPEPAVLDVGTGSGAIAVAVARQHKGARLTATDLSPAALALAERNAARHSLAERVRFLHGDLFAPLPPGEQFEFILSNPPYIAHEDMERLPVGVRHYEPHLALDGGPGGFAVFDRLVDGARQFLRVGGYLIVEIGSPQEDYARQRIAACSDYELGKTIRDGSGHPRVLVARRQC
jgi:release factor glutamine methyltransferase